MSASSSPQPRVRRKHDPERVFTKAGYRNARPLLREDFQQRCAYSMVHENFAGGVGGMNIDHFDPRRKNDFMQRYGNLFWSIRECNGKKSNHWPTAAEEQKGIRFLDCTKERDYDVHIFEDPDTHEVWGATIAGRYHVRILNLNADFFVEQRRLRARASLVLQATALQIRSKTKRGSSFQDTVASPMNIVALLGKVAQGWIPPITFRKKP